MLKGYWLDLGLIPYAPAFAIQNQVLQARMEGRLPATIILQENPLTFTIGRSGSRANILLSPDELARRGIEVLEVNRGGDVTYHGPGQLIVSPLLYLGDVDLNANQYLHRLEDPLIELLADYDIQASKKPDRRAANLPGPGTAPATGAARGPDGAGRLPRLSRRRLHHRSGLRHRRRIYDAVILGIAVTSPPPFGGRISLNDVCFVKKHIWKYHSSNVKQSRAKP